MLRGLTRWICGASFILVAASSVTTGVPAEVLAKTSGEVFAKTSADLPDDPVGVWGLKCVSPDGKTRECVVTISGKGTALKGACAADGVTRAAKEVVFKQGVLSVGVDGVFAGQSYGLVYKGKPAGGVFNGRACWTYGWASGSFAFQGKRIPPIIAAVP